MRLRALLLSALVVLCAALGAVAYAGTTGDKPSLGDLIGSSLRAASGQDDLKVHYALTARLDATPSAQATEQTRRFLSDPISVSASGGLSEDAVTVAGTVGLLGRSYRAEALLGRHETYVNLLGAWYGDRSKGLRDARRSAEDRAGSSADPETLRRTLRWVHDHADEVLDAQVTAGPDIDGETWQARGACRPAALIILAERSGVSVSAEDRRAVEAFCRLAEFTYVVGADDRLPRRLRVVADLDGQALTRLGAAGGDDASGELDALRMEFDVKLTQWGEDVSYEAPADVKPMEDMGMALLGLMLTGMS
jgi:hypothetical protein